MLAKTQKFKSKLAAIAGSRWFFWFVIGLFVVEAAWIALSSRFPMAFDEGTHLGMIELYSQQLGPFMQHQPPGPAPFGEIVHNPSYLYYWLMSFPYRWLHGSLDLQTLVVFLRFINIAFFTGGLLLFRKVLQKTKASAAVIHVTLLFFVLIPTVSLLAGQVNYDNLLFLLLAWNLLLVLQFRELLLRKKICNIGLLLSTLAVAMLASLVKYAYTPILAGIVLYLIFLLWSSRKSVRKSWRKNWLTAPALQKYSVLAVFVLLFGMFVSMYGVNLAMYHRIAPKCDQVLNAERCMAFGPWARNYQYGQQVPANINPNPLLFTGGWLQGMFDRTFFVINGPTGSEPYHNKPPLPLMSVAAIAIFISALYPIVRYHRQLFRGDPVLGILLFITFVYGLALWGRLYYTYLQYGRLVAINGRYLLLVILPVLLLFVLAYRQWIPSRSRGWLLAILLLLFMQGGGIISFIYFSNPNWYWTDNPTVQRINHNTQQLVRPFIVNWPPGWKL